MILPTCLQGCAPASDRIFTESPSSFAGDGLCPFQRWCPTYEPEVGFNRGTMFPELDKPFLGRGGRKPWKITVKCCWKRVQICDFILVETNEYLGYPPQRPSGIGLF